MFCTFRFCYVHPKLETLNTIRKNKWINFLLIGRKKKKTNIYFVTCICTLTTHIDIFRRFFVVPQNTCIHPNTCTSSLAPPKTRASLEKSHPPRTACVVRLLHSARTRSNWKNSSPARPSPSGS